MTVVANKAVLATFRAWRGTPFVWGVADCLCFAAACAQALVGRDPAAELRGRYDSEESALQLMAENGWRDMGDVAASMFKEIPVAQARPGDWAQIRNDNGTDGLGVVSGSTIAVRTPNGMGIVALTRAARAFRVA
jgi:hypothetical protein